MTDFKVLKEKIHSNEITNWYQLIIECDLIGIKADSELVIRLLKNRNMEDPIPIPMRNGILWLISDTLKNNDAMDCYFENDRLIYSIMKCKDDIVDYNRGGFEERFNPIEILKCLDNRNPRYLLKFFLNTVPYDYMIKDKVEYYKLFKTVLARTKLRFKSLEEGSKQKEKFKDILGRLLKREDEIYAYMRNFNI